MRITELAWLYNHQHLLTEGEKEWMQTYKLDVYYQTKEIQLPVLLFFNVMQEVTVLYTKYQKIEQGVGHGV